MPLKNSLERRERRADERTLRQRVLDDLVLPLRAADLPAQLGDLGHFQTLEVHQHRALGALERALELLQLFFLARSCYCHD